LFIATVLVEWDELDIEALQGLFERCHSVVHRFNITAMILVFFHNLLSCVIRRF